MALKISLQEAIRRVREARTLADIEALFRDAFGLSEAQIKGARGIPGLPDAEAPIELTQAAKMANPNYDKGGGYTTNCQRCVVVYELLRRGYRVFACPGPVRGPNGTSKRRGMNGSECFKNPVIHGNGYNNESALTKKGLYDAINDLPDGARIVIFWAARSLSSGHAIVCEKVGDKPLFLDPQNGHIGDHVLGEANPGNGYYWYRTDNLELREDFEWNEVIE